MADLPEHLCGALQQFAATEILMRIAQMIDSLKIGGAQMLQITFARAAKMRNLSVTILSLNRDIDSPIPSQLHAAGINIEFFPSPKLLSPTRIAALISYLRAQNFDVLQTHLSSANILGALAGKASGTPVVATLHSASFDPRYHRPSRHNLESWALRHGARRVVAVGHVVAEAHQSRLKGKTIDVIPNAVVSLERIEEKKRLEIRRSITGDDSTTILLSVGRLSLPKGYHDLISAFACIRRSNTHCVLAIVGGGVLHDQLAAQIQQLGLDGSVLLLGQRDDVPSLLQAADIYVSSSHWEGLPVSVLEAMSASLPIIATNVGDLKHIVTPENGILVPPKDSAALATAMSQLISSHALRMSMGRAAEKYVLDNHSPLRWIDRYLSLYQQVIGETASEKPIRIKQRREAIADREHHHQKF